jgi:hypothetical protein
VKTLKLGSNLLADSNFGGPSNDHGKTTPYLRLVPRAGEVKVVPKEPPPAPEIKVEVDQAQVPTLPPDQWEPFKNIGLAPKKKPPSTSAARLIVSTYRALGFGILTTIVIVLIGYVAVTVFYLVSTSWLVPTVVSKTDDKVVALQGQLAALQNERDRMSDALADSERAVAVEELFQSKFAAAILSDLRGRRAALARYAALARETSSVRERIRTTSEEYAQDAVTEMTHEYDAGLIDRHDMLDGKHQLAQISSSNLSLAERQAAFETQAAELSRQATALDAVLADKNAPLSYDVLKIRRDYEASKLVLAKAIATKKSLLAGLARQDQLIASLQSSAELRALADGASVALVPYKHLDRVKPGTPLYACRLNMLVCRKVGAVLAILPGEQQFKHPQRDSNVRGQLVEMKLDDASAAQADVLFIGGKPLGL